MTLLSPFGESWLGIFALTSPLWLLAAMRIRQTLQRRRAFREFATERDAKEEARFAWR